MVGALSDDPSLSPHETHATVVFLLTRSCSKEMLAMSTQENGDVPEVLNMQAVRVAQNETDQLRPYGVCLAQHAHINFPSGKVLEGEVWQHTDGARCIYAAIFYEGEY